MIGRLWLLFVLLLAPHLARADAFSNAAPFIPPDGVSITIVGGKLVAAAGVGNCFASDITCTTPIFSGARGSSFSLTAPLGVGGNVFGDNLNANVTITGTPLGALLGTQFTQNFSGTGTITGSSHIVGLNYALGFTNTGPNNLVRNFQSILNFNGQTTAQAQWFQGEAQWGGTATVTLATGYGMTWLAPTGSTVGTMTDFNCLANTGGATINARFCLNNGDPTARINTVGPITNPAGEFKPSGIGGDAGNTRRYMGNRVATDLSTFTASGTVALYSTDVVVTAGKIYYIPFAHRAGSTFTYNHAYIRIDGAVAASSCFGQAYATAIGGPNGAPLWASPVTWATTATGEISATISGGWSPIPGVYLLAIFCDHAVTVRMYPENWAELDGSASLTAIPQALVSSTTPSAFNTTPGFAYAASGAGANIATPMVGLSF